MSIAGAGELSIGNWKWVPNYGTVTVKYKSGAENFQVRADGRDDARQTFRGRKLAELQISFTWKEDSDGAGGQGPIDTYVTDMLTDLSPRGKNAGKSWAWVERDQRLHNVNNITIDDMETVRTPGSGSASATIKASSWVKPAVRPPVTATPTTPDQWSPGPTTAPAPPAPRAGGFAATPVKAKP